MRRDPERSSAYGAVFETHHAAGSALEYHAHRYGYAAIVVQGSFTEVRDSVPERYAQASVIVHPPHEEHADFFSSDSLCLNVELPCAPTPHALHGPSECRVREAAAAVVATFYDGAVGTAERLDAAVAHLASALAHSDAPPFAPRPAWLSSVLQQFAWSDAQPLRAAAHIAGVHQTHFSRSFRRHVGMTAQTFRLRARVRLASQLLIASRAPVAQVGLQCGFADQAHFTRAFSHAVGVTPAQYRRIFGR